MAKTRASVDVDAAVRRSRQAVAAAPPPPPEATVDEDALDQLEALYDHLSSLQAGGGAARLDVYKLRPLPPDFRGARMWIDCFEDLRTIDNLERELVRVAQGSGHAGEILVQLIPKVRNEVGRWVYDKPTVTLGLYVPPSETAAATRAALAQAPAAPAAPAVDPIKAAEAMLEAGKRLTPQPQTTQPDFLDLLAKAKAAGLIGDSGIEKLMPFVPAVTSFVERMFTPKPSPYDKFVEAFLQREFREERRGREEPPEPPETLTDRLGEMRAVFEMASSVFGLGSAGDRPTVGVEVVRLAPQIIESISKGFERTLGPNFGNNAINFARERMYYVGGAPVRRPARAPAAPPPRPEAATAMPPPGSPAAELAGVLEQASPWAEAGDERRYPELLAALCARVQGAGGLLNELQAGRTDEATVYASLNQLGVEVIDPLDSYLKRFLTWVRAGAGAPVAPPPAPPPPAEKPATAASAPLTPSKIVDAPVVGRCNRCGAEYDYPSLEQLKADTAPCEIALREGPCGGRIEPIGGGR